MQTTQKLHFSLYFILHPFHTCIQKRDKQLIHFSYCIFKLYVLLIVSSNTKNKTNMYKQRKKYMYNNFKKNTPYGNPHLH